MSSSALDGAWRERYSRQLVLEGMGERGQQRLSSSCVLVIGAGGLGSPVLLYLAAAGVGTIGVADCDVVELSNLQRQVVHAECDLGRPKAESAAETITALNPGVKVNILKWRVASENIADTIAPYDFIVDATDSFESKYLINDACVIAGKPYSHGGIRGWWGQTMTYVPGQGPCLRCLFPEPPPEGTVPAPRQAGVLGALAGTIGSIQAAQAVKFLAKAGSLLVGAMITYDALKDEVRKVRVPRNPVCQVCANAFCK